jgi:hypothetical protein
MMTRRISQSISASAGWCLVLHKAHQKVDGPSGPFTIRQGVIFNPGALLLGLDLAKELDRMAAEER